MWLGRLLLWAATITAFAAAFTYARAELMGRRGGKEKEEKRRSRCLQGARRLFWLTGFFIAATMVYLWWLILTERYEVAYVHDYTDRSLPILFRFAAFWGGQAGTWLLWAFFTTLWGLFLLRFSKPYETATLSILSGLNFLLLLPVTISSIAGALMESGWQAPSLFHIALEDPFRLLHPPPDDGRGLNPLLQNFWMSIHPPTMFLGYASMGLPFALALAGLWRRDWHGWTLYAFPSACLGIFALGLGIVLGGIWSYEVLGWGGYWAWDPVENASFIPWLVCVALLHALIVQRATKSMARLTTFLGLIAFLTAYYATFVTRSGFIQSVHAFTTTAITWWVLGILTFLTLFTFGSFFLRLRQVPPVNERPGVGDLWSFHFFAYAGMAVAGLFALFIFLGLSAPWITIIGRALGFQVPEITLNRDFYDRASLPYGVIMALLLALMPLFLFVQPKEEEQRKMWKGTVPWLVANIVLMTAIIAFLFGIRKPVSLLLVGVASACIVGNLYALFLRARKSPLTVGAYLAHLGLGLFLLGVVGSELHDNSRQLVIPTGEHRTAFGYLLTFNGHRERPDGKQEFLLSAIRLDGIDGHGGVNGPDFIAKPVMFFDTRFGLVRTPFIKRFLTHDLYIEPVSYVPPQEAGVIALGRGEMAEVGGWKVKFVKFELSGKPIMGMPEKIATVVELSDGEKTYTLKPYWRMKEDGGIEEKEATLPGKGISIAIDEINAEQRLVHFRIKGVEGLQGHRGFLVINVQWKPAVNLVWLGAFLVLFGVLLSGVRRIREATKIKVIAAFKAGKRKKGRSSF